MADVTQPFGKSERFRFALVALFFLAFTGFGTLTMFESGLLSKPPEAGDGPDYDNIAWNLSRGQGYGYDWADPTWRAPYEASGDPQYEGLLNRRGGYRPTAQRPPLYPALLGTTYALFGRSFETARLLNVILFAGAASIMLSILLRQEARLAGVFFVILVLKDPSYALWSYYLYSEALFLFLISILIHQMIRLDSASATRFNGIAIGGLLAALILTRSIFLFWLPFVGWAIVRMARQRGRPKLALEAFLIMGISLCCWGARNLVALGHFLPLGTQGGINLAVDYSDDILAAGGLWTSQSAAPTQKAFVDVWNGEGLPLEEREVAQNYWGTARAFQWIGDNWPKVPVLVYLKATSLLWHHALLYQRILLILFFGVVWWCFRAPRNRLLLGLFLANSFGVLMTHNVPAGRFLLPAELIIAYLLSAGLACVLNEHVNSHGPKADDHNKNRNGEHAPAE